SRASSRRGAGPDARRASGCARAPAAHTALRSRSRESRESPASPALHRSLPMPSGLPEDEKLSRRNGRRQPPGGQVGRQYDRVFGAPGRGGARAPPPSPSRQMLAGEVADEPLLEEVHE